MPRIKVYELRSWKNPRGFFLVAATSKVQAAKILRCGKDRLTSAIVLSENIADAQLALQAPFTPHYREKYGAPYRQALIA